MRTHARSSFWLAVVLIAVAVVLALWYFFRPERLFINKTVNEPIPQSMILRHSMISAS